MQTKTLIVKATALAPIVHTEILRFVNGAPVQLPKGEYSPVRTVPLILEGVEKGYVGKVPCVSGNGIRGLGRRKLVDFSFDVLEVALGDFMKANEARTVSQFLRGGGLAAKGMSPKAVQAGVYNQLRRALPFLDLLGGVFRGHHFEGSLRAGILLTVTQETLSLVKQYCAEDFKESELPKLSDLGGHMQRYSRTEQNERTNESDDPEQMLYGAYVIPAGTKLVSENICVSQNEGAKLAFDAMFALIAEDGFIGGMSRAGHGRVLVEAKDTAGNILNVAAALENYAKYLADHKEEIVAALAEIPLLLQEQTKEEKAAKKATGKKKAEQEGLDIEVPANEETGDE